MVVDSLDGRSCEKAYSLARRHTCKLVTNAGANGVEKEALERVVVQGTIGIWHMQQMVTRVEGSYKQLV